MPRPILADAYSGDEIISKYLPRAVPAVSADQTWQPTTIETAALGRLTGPRGFT